MHQKRLIEAIALAVLVLTTITPHVAAQCGTTKEWVSAFDVAVGDLYGSAVSMTPNIWAVGAPNWDRMGFGQSDDAGVVYPLYVTGGTIDVYGNSVMPNDASAGKHFGRAVAIDGETLVVGAESSAYVFTKNAGDSWTQRAKLTPTVPASTMFGSTVAINGDTIVVGDPGADSNIGAIYIYARNGLTWPLQQKISAPDPSFQPQFGNSVSVWGDTVVAGAPWGTGSQFQIGTVYVFVLSGMTWSQQGPLLEIAGAPSFTKLGTSVALRGNRLLAGAPGTTESGQPFAGSAYFFERSGGVWTEMQEVLPAGAVANSRFGDAVALADVSALVGRPATGAGSCRLFIYQGGAWSGQNTFGPLFTAGGNENFGSTLAMAGNWGLAGSPFHDVNGTDSGAAWSLNLACEGPCCVNGACAPVSVESCATIGGTFDTAGADCDGVMCAPSSCCPGDLNSDQLIDGLDVQGLVDAMLQGATCP